MKKILVYSLAALMGVATLSSCNDDDDQLTDSRPTNYVVLAINGNQTEYVNVGDTYTDAGVTATLNGEDASDRVQTTSDVNTNELGVYHVTYSAINDDGFSASATRTVYVGTPVSATVDAASYRDMNGKVTAYGAEFPLFALTDGNGNYYVSDLLGGYYDQRAGYGVNYSMPAYLNVDASNKVSITKGGNVAGWGDTYISFDGSFDPATNTMKTQTEYGIAGMIFYVTIHFE